MRSSLQGQGRAGPPILAPVLAPRPDSVATPELWQADRQGLLCMERQRAGRRTLFFLVSRNSPHLAAQVLDMGASPDEGTCGLLCLLLAKAGATAWHQKPPTLNPRV
jgi:hypothetical protein